MKMKSRNKSAVGIGIISILLFIGLFVGSFFSPVRVNAETNGINGNAAAGTSVTTGLFSPVSGDTVIVLVEDTALGGTASISSVADSYGDTYHLYSYIYSGTAQKGEAWYTVIGSGSGEDLIMASGNNGGLGIAVLETASVYSSFPLQFCYYDGSGNYNNSGTACGSGILNNGFFAGGVIDIGATNTAGSFTLLFSGPQFSAVNDLEYDTISGSTKGFWNYSGGYNPQYLIVWVNGSPSFGTTTVLTTSVVSTNSVTIPACIGTSMVTHTYTETSVNIVGGSTSMTTLCGYVTVTGTTMLTAPSTVTETETGIIICPTLTSTTIITWTYSYSSGTNTYTGISESCTTSTTVINGTTYTRITTTTNSTTLTTSLYATATSTILTTSTSILYKINAPNLANFLDWMFPLLFVALGISIPLGILDKSKGGLAEVGEKNLVMCVLFGAFLGALAGTLAGVMNFLWAIFFVVILGLWIWKGR